MKLRIFSRGSTNGGRRMGCGGPGWAFFSIYKFVISSGGGGQEGGISGINLVQVCHWASSYTPDKCILEYGKSIPINV